MGLTRTRIIELLEAYDLGPSRALGQNFLCDVNMVDKIVRLAGVAPGDAVIEIGPGLGSLTLALCRAGCRVKAVEIDRYLIPPLREVTAECRAEGRLEIINADAMTVDWDPIVASSPRWAVVANLPYNIATPLILDLLVQQPSMTRWLVMVQREAGERLVAEPGSKTYGIPSVLTAYWAKARIVGSVGADLFLPRPKVESVLVRIDRHPSPPVDVDYRQLATVVKTGFGQRRKMLRRSLASLIDADGFAQAGIDPTERPEQLSLDQWAALARLVPAPASNPNHNPNPEARSGGGEPSEHR